MSEEVMTKILIDRVTAEQALEALKEFGYHGSSPRWERTANALTAALEQPVQEPVALRMPKVGDKVICLEDESLGEVVSLTAGGSPDITFDDGSHGTYLLHEFAELFGYVAPPLPVQEPVAWMCNDFDGDTCELTNHDECENPIPLYTAPPQRQWVGLTDEEIKEIHNESRGKDVGVATGLTERKLKKKNTTPPLPVQEPQQWAVFCAGCHKEWSVPYQHPGKSVCADCEAKLKAQSEQEDAFEGWVKIDELREHFNAVNCGTIYRHGGEGRVLLRATPPKREWVGLKDEDMNDPRTQNFDFIYGARWAESKLKERNNG